MMRVHYLVMVMMVAVLTNSPASASSSGSASFGSSMSGDDIPTTITAGSMSEYEPISFNRDLAVEQNENNDKASLRIHSDVDESSGEDEERYSNKLSWNQFAKMLSSSAYRDMGDELVEETDGVCHESPAKKSFFSPKLSESMILNLKQRRAVRAKVVVILSLLLSASVAAASLYTLVDATALTMKMRGAYPIFRGTSSVPKKSEVYSGEGVPNVGDAMLSTDVTATQRETDYAQDDAMLEDLDPYDEFHPVGRQLEVI